MSERDFPGKAKITFGIRVPNSGPLASPESIVQVAREAESLGYDSIWVHDHLTWTEEIHRTHISSGSDDSKTGDSPDFYEAMTTLAYLPDSCGRSASALPAWWCRAGIRYSPRSKSHPLMFFATAGWTSALASARRRPSSRGNTKFSRSTENSEGKSPMIISGQ